MFFTLSKIFWFFTQPLNLEISCCSVALSAPCSSGGTLAQR
jgi:hypothetical protein